MTKKLTDIAKILMGQAPAGEAYNESGEGWRLIAGASDLGPKFPAPSRFTTSAPRLSRLNDVIVCVRATIGDVNLSDGEYCLGRGVAALRPSKAEDRDFIAYFIEHSKQALLAKGRGATFLQVSKEDIASLEFSNEVYQSRARIVARIQDCFSRLEEMEQLQSKALAQAEALTNRAIEQLWSEPEVSSASLVSLKQVADVTTGNTPSRKVPAYFSQDGVPWITPGDMNTSKVVSAGRERLSELGICEGKARVVPANSVIVCCIGATIGKVAMVMEATGLNQQLNAVTFGKDVLPDFGYWACRALYPQIISNAAQSTLPILSKGKFETLEIPIPPKPVQKRVSEALDKVHLAALEMISEGKAALESYQHLRTAILREAFSGRL